MPRVFQAVQILSFTPGNAPYLSMGAFGTSIENAELEDFLHLESTTGNLNLNEIVREMSAIYEGLDVMDGRY